LYNGKYGIPSLSDSSVAIHENLTHIALARAHAHRSVTSFMPRMISISNDQRASKFHSYAPMHEHQSLLEIKYLEMHVRPSDLAK